MQFAKTPNLPPAFQIFPNLTPPHKTLTFHQIYVLLLTFAAYASFHASRKPPSIVKTVLVSSNSTDSGWAPFNTPRGTHRLGELDLAFLASYSVGMYVSGHIGDRVNLRFFLAFGMISSGILTVAFGFGYWLDIHDFVFFLLVQIACGLCQSIGWPCVVAVVGNWFGKSKRGLIMGLWNSHTSAGNIAGSIIASAVLEFGWGWSFALPGVLVILVGVVVLGFLVVEPGDIGLEQPGNEVEMRTGSSLGDNLEKSESEDTGLLGFSENVSCEAIGFLEAWMLPGVAPFAFSLFFSKLVAYTFLYWLPFYIKHTDIAGVHVSHKQAGILSTIFDLGGVFGGVLAGYISDIISARAVTSIVFFTLSIPSLICYRIYGSTSMPVNIGLMLISGLFVNGPYALITTAVTADLGTQETVKGNSRVLATVTAIIDGTGSVGAALGPLLAGYVSTRGWNSVFFMLNLSIFLAASLLINVARSEMKGKLKSGSG